MIPQEIANDKHIRVYTKYNEEGKVIEQWYRPLSEQEKKAPRTEIVTTTVYRKSPLDEDKIVKELPVFEGAWVAASQLMLDNMNCSKESKGSKKTDNMSDNMPDSPKRSATHLTYYEKERLKAQRLLEQLLKLEEAKTSPSNNKGEID